MPPPNPSAPAAPLLPYERPRLIVFGHVEALTLSNTGGMGRNDMASGPHKTGF